jgi:hypothetical protein
MPLETGHIAAAHVLEKEAEVLQSIHRVVIRDRALPIPLNIITDVTISIVLKSRASDMAAQPAASTRTTLHPFVGLAAH